MIKNSNPPILIIGMHRSGTTLLSRILDANGWFSGIRKDDNNESTYFQKINDWILNNYGCTWEHPYNFKSDIVKDKYIIDYVKKDLNSFKSVEYYGIKRISLNSKKFYGFKDPRTSITLPIWTQIFHMEPTIIHITRNGYSVAKSILARKNLEISHYNVEKSFRSDKFKLFKRNLITNTNTINNIDEALKLWSYYENRCNLNCQNISRSHHIIYEELINNPINTLDELSDFLNTKIVLPKTILLKKENALVNVPQEYRDFLNRNGY